MKIWKAGKLVEDRPKLNTDTKKTVIYINGKYRSEIGLPATSQVRCLESNLYKVMRTYL